MQENTNQKITHLIKDSYLAAINNSLGCKLFQNFYAEIDGVKTDVMNGGELSCAFFVSSIARIFGLIENPHASITSTVKDLLESGWVEVSEPKLGSILVWEKMLFDDGEHEHIGFYIGDDRAISNNLLAKVPVEHHLTFDNQRQIVKILSHDILK